MRLWKTLGALLLFCALSVAGAAQTDPQGRQHALQMYEAYTAATQGGNYSQFEAMFMRDPQMTRRAFVSTMEYATEVYQSDMNSASQAVGFAGQLADLIAQQFGDQAPSAMLRRLLGQDPSAMAEFYQYACSVYPGYANGGGNPGYPANTGMPGGYPQQQGYPANSGPFRPTNATGGPGGG